MNTTRLVCLTLLLGIAGCTTLQSARDAANNTAGLVGELDKELREFRRVQASNDRLRKNLIREQAEAIGLTQGAMAENELFGAATADSSVLATARSLWDMTTGLAAIDTKTQAALAELDKQLAELTSPLPATTDKAIAVQEALTVMGTELSTSAHLVELKAFYKTVREGVEKNKQKIKDAELQAAQKAGQKSADAP